MRDIQARVDHTRDSLSEEVGDIKKVLEGRLNPLEDVVKKHEHTFHILGSLASWSGLGAAITGICGLILNFILGNHK
jgi:hypothetical protein